MHLKGWVNPPCAQRMECVRLVAALEDLDLSRSKRESKIPKSWHFERWTGHINDSKTFSSLTSS